MSDLPILASDNWAGACPGILDALVAANGGGAAGYGNDDWSAAATARVAEVFEREPASIRVIPVVSGTAANSLAIAAASPPWGLVLAHERAHIATDENGAPEFFSGGARVTAVPGPSGRMTVAAVADRLADAGHGVHSPVPSVLSITQPTEVGTVYTPDHVADLAAAAHDHGLVVHMDGARFANAVAHLDRSPADLTWRIGVDVLSLGATKGGALDMDAIVVFTPDRLPDLDRHVKRSGHLASKSRFLAAQLTAYLADDRWLVNAHHANSMARRLADGLGARGHDVVEPVEANMVFARLSPTGHAALERGGVVALEERIDGGRATRMVTSWATTTEEIDTVLALIAR